MLSVSDYFLSLREVQRQMTSVIMIVLVFVRAFLCGWSLVAGGLKNKYRFVFQEKICYKRRTTKK